MGTRSTVIGLRPAQRNSFGVKQAPSHPLSANRFVNTTPDSQRDLKELTAACIDGVRLRGALAQRLIKETKPRLSLLVFPEIHHAGHQMWHTVEPEHQVYSGRKLNGGRWTLLKQVPPVDRQIAGLSSGRWRSHVSFALHGCGGLASRVSAHSYANVVFHILQRNSKSWTNAHSHC